MQAPQRTRPRSTLFLPSSPPPPSAHRSAGVFTFGACVLAKTAFGFTAGQVMIFAIAVRTSSPACDRRLRMADHAIGPKKVIILSLSDGRRWLRRLPARPWPHRLLDPGLTSVRLRCPTQSASCSFLSRIILPVMRARSSASTATTGQCCVLHGARHVQPLSSCSAKHDPAGAGLHFTGASSSC